MSAPTKKPKTAKAAVPRRASTPRRPAELPDGMWERIARKAYELWDARGRQEGNALQDWLDAEQIVMDEIHEARE